MSVLTLANLRTQVNDDIKTNGVRAITGALTNKNLIDIIDSIEADYLSQDSALDTRIQSLENMTFIVLQDPQTGWDASAGTFPGGGTAKIGYKWEVKTPGVVDGVEFDDGDFILAIADNASTTTYSANWVKEDANDRVRSVRGELGDVTVVPKVTLAASDPTVTDDSNSGYLAGDIWVNTSSLDVFVSESVAVGAASWSTINGSGGGKVGIADSNGVYTYYSSLSAAITASSSGDTVQIFTSFTEIITTPLELPLGVNFNLNGNIITIDQNNANETFTTNVASGYVGKILNGKIIRLNGTGDLIRVNNSAANVEIDFTGLTTDYNGGYHLNILRVDAAPKYKNLKCIGGTNNIVFGQCGVENISVICSSGTAFQSCTNYNCYAETINGTAYVQCVSNYSVAITVSGRGFDSTDCLFCKSTSSTGDAYFSSTVINSKGFTSGGYAAIGSIVRGCDLYSISLNGATGSEVTRSKVRSDSTFPVSVGNGAIVKFNEITCNWNNAGARGIVMGTNCEISSNEIKMVNSSSYGIGFAGNSSFGGNNIVYGASAVYDPAHTVLTVNLQDNQGNLLA